ncbi:HlyD family type I secretion periplasmic adaptor subunit [Halopseudomonas xiamenensis]|uniref:HlyD family type I secretion periplasmic adaptor subunit n=1 Tax=Halopseudomonas xiamenensis TaxID=157792 RepID=UPI001624B973|nr:HlyD family type I secretion periplasmic adaptor subunit [Halopseudomonas xiamenensis]
MKIPLSKQRRSSAAHPPAQASAFAALDGVQTQYSDEVDASRIARATRITWLSSLAIAALLLWAWFAEVVEVSTGDGRVVPISREQVIQSLEGGILLDLLVREGDIVEADQILAQMDLTKTESNVEESAARYRATLGSVARLEAEVNGTPLKFPTELDDWPELIASETRLYQTRREGLRQTLAGVDKSLKLVREELEITESLMAIGAASNVEVLRLRRQISELELKAGDIRSEYMILAREELARARAEAQSLESVVRGRFDSLTRLTIRSPVRGIVKDIEVTTRGGVIPPNGRLMEIVPLGDQLLVEARISPRDIAFIHPGQPAKVKITAYDYTIYGGLDGQVALISPDTIRDEARPDSVYYRVFIRTDSDALVNQAGTRFPIVPGMIATVDIRTGQKTVFDYLMKPINYAGEALRER